MKNKFKCQKCGSKNLGLQKYVRCVTPVGTQKDSHIEYGLSKFDENDYLATENGFICLNCNAFIEHCGCKMETEDDLINYLKLSPKDRDKQQQVYDDFVIFSSNEEDEKPAGME